MLDLIASTPNAFLNLSHNLFCPSSYRPRQFRQRSHHHHHPWHPPSPPACRATGSEVVGEDIVQIFLKERQMNGDFISKASDMLWKGNISKFDSVPSTLPEELRQHDEVMENENFAGFLKLTKTQDWVAGANIAPGNIRLKTKDWKNDSEKRKKLNFLKYEAIKSEMLLLTIGIGATCSVYCLVQISVEAAVSYAFGVFFSFLYLQLLYYHTDSLSKEAVPKIFVQKKVKKIGIRSEDLKNSFEKALYGSTMALSSPRLVIPGAIYGLWALSQHVYSDFAFQLVPAMFGFFAYKAAALVQVYRDNQDLRLIFPDDDESSSSG